MTSHAAVTAGHASLVERIQVVVARHEREMRDLTAALVAIPTENPPGRRYAECVRLLTAKLRELKLPAETVPVPARANGEPRRCVLSSLGPSAGGSRRTVYFHGHYDVVPASVEGQFRPAVRRGHLFGRGSADMKAGVAAMIHAMAVLSELNLPLAGRVGLVLVPDEETGGAGGSRYLMESGRLGRNGIAMFTPEPTSGVIWNACRGAISMRVTVQGKPAHVGLHFRGVNAFERGLNVAEAFLGLARRVSQRRTRYPVTPAAARNSVLLVGGQSAGGANFNAVPGEFSFTVDRRMNPEEPLAREKRALLAVVKRFRTRGVDCAVEIFQEEPAAGVSSDSPAARVLAQCAREITGRSPRFEMCPGLLETRFYAQRSVPAFAYGPGQLEVAHGPNECVSLNKVREFAAIYALSAARLLAPAHRL